MNKKSIFILATTVAVASTILYLYSNTVEQTAKHNNPIVAHSITSLSPEHLHSQQPPQSHSNPMKIQKNSSKNIILYNANLVTIIGKLNISSVEEFDTLLEENSPVILFNKLTDELLLDKTMPDSEKASLIWELLGKYDPNSPVGLKLLDVLASANGGRYFSHELMDMFTSPLMTPAAQANIIYALSGVLNNSENTKDKNFLSTQDFIRQQFYATNDKNTLKALLDFTASSFNSENDTSDNTFALSVLESKKSLLTEAERMSYRLAFTSPSNISNILTENFSTQKKLQPEVQVMLYGHLQDLSVFAYPDATARQVLDSYLNRNPPANNSNGNEYIQNQIEWLKMKAIAASESRKDYQDYLFNKALISTDTLEKATILNLAIKDAKELEKPELLNRLLMSTTIKQDIETKLSTDAYDPSVSELFRTVLSNLK